MHVLKLNQILRRLWRFLKGKSDLKTKELLQKKSKACLINAAKNYLEGEVGGVKFIEVLDE